MIPTIISDHGPWIVERVSPSYNDINAVRAPGALNTAFNRTLTDTSAWSIRRLPDGRLRETHWEGGVELYCITHPYGADAPANWRKRKKMLRKAAERMRVERVTLP